MEYIICPLTKLIYCDPVVAEDTYIYEYLAIKDWLRHNNRSPITNEKMGTRLIRATPIKKMVTRFLENTPELLDQQFMQKKPVYLFRDDLYENLKEKNEELIKNFTSFSLTSEYNNGTLFEYICKNLSEDTIIYIIDNSIDYDVEDDRKLRPIHLACKYSTPKVIKYLIEKGVDLESRDALGNRPLSYAILYNKNMELIEYMLSKQIDVNYENESGLRTIAYVLLNGDIPMFKLFTKYGLNYYCNPKRDMNILEYAFTHCSSMEMLKYLINHEEVFNALYMTAPESKVYDNQNLNPTEKQEIVYIYLNKVFNMLVIDENFEETLGENNKKLEENNKNLEENNKNLEENNKNLEENNKKLEENNKNLEENNKNLEENNKNSEENNKNLEDEEDNN